MKVVVAMDSFKGNMSARDACTRVRDAIWSIAPDTDVVMCPMADGGEGTAEALMTARDGQWIEHTVMGPLPTRTVEAGYVWFPDDASALVEMATASGIMLLDRAELDPLITTTYGTGELIKAAVRHGAKRVIVTVGGSATVDGGVGAAMALGWRFKDARGDAIQLGGRHVGAIRKIIPPDEHIAIPVEVLCDVDNPLLGDAGAAQVFGPQKGATDDMVELLEEGLTSLAAVINDQLHTDIRMVPGGGAAGGLAAGLIAFAQARLVPGIDTVMEASKLDEAMKGADWVLSGEGRFDSQSLRGKVVSGIIRRAREQQVKTGVLAGTVQVDEKECREQGLAFAWSTAPNDIPMEVALRTAKEDLSKTTKRFAEQYLT